MALAPYEHLIIKGKEAISAAIPIVDGKVNYVGGWFGVAPMSCPAELGKPAVVEQFAAVLRASQQMTDAILALIALGYKQVDAHKAVKAVAESRPGQTPSSDDLVRESLKRLA